MNVCTETEGQLHISNMSKIIYHLTRKTSDSSFRQFGWSTLFGTNDNYLNNNFWNKSTRKIHSAEDSELAKEQKEMAGLLPDIVKNLTNDVFEEDSLKWIKKVLEYNVLNGKQIRAFATIITYKELLPKKDISNENLRLIRIMAWCLEIVQAFHLVMDDIIDNGTTRRGQPCWYLYNNIGNAAVNDGLFLQESAYRLLKLNFQNKPYYVDVMEMFHEVRYKSSYGDMLDLLSTNFGKKNLNLMTMDRYEVIAKNKTAFSTFVVPVKLAMLMAGLKGFNIYEELDDILLDIGYYYQVQDDYFDFCGFRTNGPLDVSDIQEGRCTWLLAAALQKASPEQYKIIEECYSVKDLEKSMRVLEVYNELNLENIYLDYKVQICNSIQNRIDHLSPNFPCNSLNKLLNIVKCRKH